MAKNRRVNTAKRRRINWRNEAFGADDAFEASDLDRLAALAKVEEAHREIFKRRLGEIGAKALVWKHVLLWRPTEAQIGAHLKRIQATALKLQSLLLGMEDTRVPTLPFMTASDMPEVLRATLAQAVDRLIEGGQPDPPPGFPAIFEAPPLGEGAQYLATIVNALRQLTAASAQGVELTREKAKFGRRRSSLRGYTVETDIADHALKLYSALGLPYRHNGKRGGCGATRFALEVLDAMRRKVPELRPLSRKTIQDRLLEHNRQREAKPNWRTLRGLDCG